VDYTLQEVMRWASHMALGLKALDGARIVHGDVTLRNVLLSGKGDAIIADPGIAREWRRNGLEPHDFTQATNPYVAPEVRLPDLNPVQRERLYEGVVGSKLDVWAWGVCVWGVVLQKALDPHWRYDDPDCVAQLDAMAEEEDLETQLIAEIESVWSRGGELSWADRMRVVTLAYVLSKALIKSPGYRTSASETVENLKTGQLVPGVVILSGAV
jgi:serine/threonine protein kinase